MPISLATGLARIKSACSGALIHWAISAATLEFGVGEPSMPYLRLADDPSLMLHQRFCGECTRRGAFFTSHHNWLGSAMASLSASSGEGS